MWRMIAGDAGNLVAQMRRGVLPYCVLAMVRDKERYGFELVQSLSSIDGMVTGEGTIYPLLARLRRQGLVETTWRESAAGPPRRYYRIAPAAARPWLSSPARGDGSATASTICWPVPARTLSKKGQHHEH